MTHLFNFTWINEKKLPGQATPLAEINKSVRALGSLHESCFHFLNLILISNTCRLPEVSRKEAMAAFPPYNLQTTAKKAHCLFLLNWPWPSQKSVVYIQ